MRERTKIFGIGLNKTGTTTLGGALHKLGYNNGISFINNNLIDIYDRGDINFFLSLSEDYTFFEDIPWALLYKEFYQKYPNAYFILTTRKDPQTWYRSLCNHILRGGGNAAYSNSVIYGAPDPLYAKRKFISYYKKHNNEVRSYFKDNPKFIEVCWEKGDGWERICQLLNKKIPQKVFPHLNQFFQKKNTLKERIFKRKKISARHIPSQPSEYKKIDSILVTGKSVIIKGIFIDEEGYNQIHKMKLLLNDGSLSVPPHSVELIHRPKLNALFPYIRSGEKVGFEVKFVFPYEISNECDLSIQVDGVVYQVSY